MSAHNPRRRTAYPLPYPLSLLKLLVEVERTVEERRAGTSGAVFAGGFNGRFLDAGVGDKAGIAIGAEHQHFFAVDDYFGLLLGRDGAEIRIYACGLGLLRSCVFCEFGL